MTREQAEEIVALLRAATGGRTDEMTIEYFEVALQDMDYDMALATATIGKDLWRFFPSWADFKEIYRTQDRLLREPTGEQRVNLPPKEKYGGDAPEWVWVWGWCRRMRSPRCFIPFPQQQLPDSEPQLSMEEYEALREEWVAAGKPKAQNPLPLARE